MKTMVFGSLNIDHIYQLLHFTRPGETIIANDYQKHAGGKGFNQAIALAKAGQKTALAGMIGQDGLFLKEFLFENQIDTSLLKVVDAPTGHTIIQVDSQGANSIIVYGGANQKNTPENIEHVLAALSEGDILFLQNEISHVVEIIQCAHNKNIRIVLNPSPVIEEMKHWPLDCVDYIILNEVEGEALTEQKKPSAILDCLLQKYTDCHFVLTLGENGSIYADKEQLVMQPAFPTKAVDTTAAGDTFTGYFFSMICQGESIKRSLEVAALASSIAIGRHGAAESIPLLSEVLEML
jgi:ribokinase